MSSGLEWDLTGQVDSREVMQTNAKTASTFPARVVGKYQRVGPNSWDPYKLVAEDGRSVEVPPGLEIQVEDYGARFRVRARGAVHVLEWQPAEGETSDEAEQRAIFLKSCVSSFKHKAGIGAAAFIAKTLK